MSKSSIELIYGDCIPILPKLDRINFVLTDPPYGIGDKWGDEVKGKNGKSRLWNGTNDWDRLIDNDIILSLTKYPSIIWGGNYYDLPPVRSWLIWDKMQKFDGADFEMAWTNLETPPRAFRMPRIDAYVNKAETKKVHPTEKPLPLMVWCIEKFTKPGDTILDPFMGSGTTGVACARLGRNFIGIEKKVEYFAIAQTRIAKAQQQMVMEFA